MAAPNIQISSNPMTTGGNTSGVVVGENTDQTLGFFGAVGTTKPEVEVTAEAIHAALVAFGLISSVGSP